MLRSWLLTPFLNPATPSQTDYNTSHCSTHRTIERCNEVNLKRRWHCTSYIPRYKASILVGMSS